MYFSVELIFPALVTWKSLIIVMIHIMEEMSVKWWCVWGRGGGRKCNTATMFKKSQMTFIHLYKNNIKTNISKNR